MSHSFVKVYAFSVFLGLMFVATIRAQEQASYTAKNPRPLYEVVQSLENQYGQRITYEDPPFENPEKLKDLISPPYRATHPDAKDAVLIPVTLA